jgi:hypothetical protein
MDTLPRLRSRRRFASEIFVPVVPLVICLGAAFGYDATPQRQSAGDSPLKQRFLAEYPSDQKALSHFYSHVRMKVAYSYEGYADGVRQRELTEEYAANGSLLLRKAVVEKWPSQPAGREEVSIANPGKSFFLRRDSADAAFAILGKSDYSGPSILFSAKPLYASFAFLDMTLWKAIHEEAVISWDVNAIRARGESLAEVTWRERPDESGWAFGGKVIVEPACHWRIREYWLFHYKDNAAKPIGALRGVVEYNGLLNGIPLVKKVGLWAENYDPQGGVTAKKNLETFDVTSLQSATVPENEFALEPYGLKDPEAIRPTATRWWLWGALAGGALLALAAVFGWLRQRASMTHRVMLLLGAALFALAAGSYLTDDRGVVSIDKPERELVLRAGTTTPLTFHIHNPTRRAVRVVGLAGC